MLSTQHRTYSLIISKGTSNCDPIMRDRLSLDRCVPLVRIIKVTEALNEDEVFGALGYAAKSLCWYPWA